MGNINSVSAGQNTATAYRATGDDGDNNLYKEKLVFRPEELGIKGDRPPTVVLTEKQVETKIFQKYGFDVRNNVQMEMLKLRFDTKQSPYESIDWQKGKFVARLNSNGQYEITVGLRERTLEALSGRLLSTPSPTTGGNTEADANVTTASRLGIDSTDYRRRQLENKLPPPSLDGLTPEQQDLVLDLTQVGLSVVGIFDPTGIADGTDAAISLGRGDYWGAGISALGIVPYIGDIAKIGKLPKLLKIIDKVVDMAKADGKFAKIVAPLLENLNKALGKLPLDKLPKWAKEPIETLKTKIDDFFEAKNAVSKTPKVDYKGQPYSIKDRERIAELGKDPKRGILPEEGEAGLAAEKQYGMKLSRNADESVEFVDDAGRAWDAFSPISKAPNGKMVFKDAAVTNSLKAHLRKGNVILDYGRLNPADASRLDAIVNSLTKADMMGNEIKIVRR